MKSNFKRVLALVMAALMSLCLFTACGESEAEKLDKLCGVWTMTEAEGEKLTREILEYADFYDDEISLIDLNSLNYVQLIEFKLDGSYSYVYDVEATKAEVRAFFARVFDTLYENRAKVDDLYKEDLTGMDKDTFLSFYAALYDFDSMDKLLDALANGAYTYDEMSVPWEAGTFTLEDNKILCTVTGETEAASMQYKISNGTLTLTYSDGVEVYTKK